MENLTEFNICEEVMSYQTLSYERKGYIGIIDLNGPLDEQVKTSQLSDELADLLAVIAWKNETRVIILTGSGERPFSVSSDLIKEVWKISEQRRKGFWSLAEPIAKLDRPVIAAIKGDAIGQGLELALACDLRIATETSHFGFPQIMVGSIPWDGGTQRLSRLVGKPKAMEMMLTGEIINAKEADRIGLINKVVPPGDLMAVGMEMAREMASRAPIALRYAKEAVHKGMDLTLEQGLRLEADLYLLLHTTNDRAEGITAFRKKRTPQFKGR